MYIYTHIHMIHRPAKEERGSAATGPPSSLYVIPSGIYLFVILARVSVHRTRGLFWMFVGLFWVTTGLCWGCESECTALCLRSRTLSILWRARRNARTNAHTHTHSETHTQKNFQKHMHTRARKHICIYPKDLFADALSLSRARSLSRTICHFVILSSETLVLSFFLFTKSTHRKEPCIHTVAYVKESYIHVHEIKKEPYMHIHANIK